jgi:hypothetical protein
MGVADVVEGGAALCSGIVSSDISPSDVAMISLRQTGRTPSLPCGASSRYRAFDRINYILPHVKPRQACLQRIAEDLAHIWRLTKDTTRHRDWKRRYREHGRGSIVRETADDDGREGSQLGSGAGQQIAGDGVALVDGAEHDRKQEREIGWRSRVGLPHKFVDGVEFPGLKDHGGERGFEALIAGAQDGGDRTAADPMAGTFVGDSEPPASGTSGATVSVAAVDDGTGASDRDHAGTGAESGFEGNGHIADNFDFWERWFGSYFGN